MSNSSVNKSARESVSKIAAVQRHNHKRDCALPKSSHLGLRLHGQACSYSPTRPEFSVHIQCSYTYLAECVLLVLLYIGRE